MNTPLDSLLSHYHLQSVNDSVQALREIAQQIALLGLWRGKFFERASFYGGTALRIAHGLDRYSEDMDFSLNETDANFSLLPYMDYVSKELGAFGFEVSVVRKSFEGVRTIERAFLKMNSRINLLVIGAPQATAARIAREQVLKIKFEVDIDPPPGFATETTFLYQPQAFSVRTFDLPSMFAGKFHAAVARAWKGRVKGRDWYDVAWFVGRDVPVSLSHLTARMKQTQHLKAHEKLSAERARKMLLDRIETLDIDAARRDVSLFLRNPSAADVWSTAFFGDVARRMRFE